MFFWLIFCTSVVRHTGDKNPPNWRCFFFFNQNCETLTQLLLPVGYHALLALSYSASAHFAFPWELLSLSSEEQSFPHPPQPPSLSLFLPPNLGLISFCLSRAPTLTAYLPGIQWYLWAVRKAPPQVLLTSLFPEITCVSVEPGLFPLAVSHSTMLLFSSVQGLPIPQGRFKCLFPKACFCCWASNTLICALTSCSRHHPSFHGIPYMDPDTFTVLRSFFSI